MLICGNGEHVKSKKAQVATYLRNFLTGAGDPWDWDDFISTPLDDLALDRVRIRCGEMPDRFPPERANEYCSEKGIEELSAILQSLSPE